MVEQNGNPASQNVSTLIQGLDPQLVEALEMLVQAKMSATEQAYHQEFWAHQEAWQSREKEGQAREAALQAELENLKDEIAATKTQSGSVLLFFFRIGTISPESH